MLRLLRHIISLFPLLALLPAVFAQTATTAPANGTAPVGLPQQQVAYPIPFTPDSDKGVPLIHVRLNGRVDATFMVDTGTDMCIIFDDLVTKLGAKPHPAKLGDQPLIMYGKQAQAIDLTSLQIGDASAKHPLLVQPLAMPVVVMPGQQIRKFLAAPVDGIIGADLLAHFAVCLDYRQRVITFLYPGSLSEAQIHYSAFNPPFDVPIPMSLPAPKYAYFVPVQISNGNVSRQTSLVLDTGAQGTILPRSLAVDLSLKPAGQFQLSRMDGKYVEDVAQVSSLHLGGVEIKDFPVAYPHSGDDPAAIGADVFSNYRVLLDFPAKKMYISPPVTFAPPIHIGPASLATPPTTTPKQTGNG